MNHVLNAERGFLHCSPENNSVKNDYKTQSPTKVKIKAGERLEQTIAFFQPNFEYW